MLISDNWGLTPYRVAWERQKSLWLNLQNDSSAPEYIVTVEHPDVYTLGFHGNEGNLLASEESLRGRGAECVRIERGGDITYHGPGQLVVYPLIKLQRHNLGVRKYVETLEKSVIELLAEYGIRATSNNDEIGVWIDRDTPRARKICAIGIKVSHGATMHGLALNVNTDLSAFSFINPCGITDKGVTSMQRELGRKIDFEKVRRRLQQILINNICS